MTLAKHHSNNTLQGDTMSVRLADTFGLTITFSSCTGGGTATIPSLKMLNFECRVLSFKLRAKSETDIAVAVGYADGYAGIFRAGRRDSHR
jgi:hypothetical protein